MLALTILFGLLGLGIIIFFHELGHFIGAKSCGIAVETFSLGWGKKLIGYNRKGTNYQISWVPVGGYCKMKGETLKSDMSEKELDTMRSEKGSFLAARPWRRAIVLAAGPLFNVAFAVLILAFIGWVGFNIQTWSNRIVLASDYGIENDEYPADIAGLETGDRILKVNGQNTDSFWEISEVIRLSGGEPLRLEIERFREETQSRSVLEIMVVPEKDPETDQSRIGIHAWIEPLLGSVDRGKPAFNAGLLSGDRILTVNSQPVRHSLDFYSASGDSLEKMDVVYLRDGLQHTSVLILEKDTQGNPEFGFDFEYQEIRSPKLGLFQAVASGFSTTFEILSLSLQGLWQLLQFRTEGLDVAGPIRITGMVGEAATAGFRFGIGTGLLWFFQILSFLSVAIAIMNLLPIPALDGGQLLLTLWEGLRKKPIKAKIILRFQVVGYLIIFLLIIGAFLGDILYIFGRR